MTDPSPYPLVSCYLKKIKKTNNLVLIDFRVGVRPNRKTEKLGEIMGEMAFRGQGWLLLTPSQVDLDSRGRYDWKGVSANVNLGDCHLFFIGLVDVCAFGAFGIGKQNGYFVHSYVPVVVAIAISITAIVVIRIIMIRSRIVYSGVWLMNYQSTIVSSR